MSELFKPPSAFELFWKAWPRGARKRGKRLCGMIWARKHLDEQAENILEVLDATKRTDEWAKDGGAFIPLPCNWLNNEMYDADLEDVEGPKAYRDLDEVIADVWPEAPAEILSWLMEVYLSSGQSLNAAAVRLSKQKKRASG